MDELRADLERALQVGGPGRYTDQVVGKLQARRRARPRRDGRGLRGGPPRERRAGRGQAAAPRAARRPGRTSRGSCARSAASGALDSPHVVRVLDAAAEAAACRTSRWSGCTATTLAELLREEPRLARRRRSSSLCAQVGAGLDAACAAGIVHRDLKPQNLFRTMRHVEDPRLRRRDPGRRATGTLTQGGIVGTPQLHGARAGAGPAGRRAAPISTRSAPSPIAALTGRHPFSRRRHAGAALRRRPQDAGAAGRESPSCPADVDRWFALALAKAARRPASRSGDELRASTLEPTRSTGALDAPGLRRRGPTRCVRSSTPWERRRADRTARCVQRAGSTSHALAADALRDEEVERTRGRSSRLGWLVAAGVIVAARRRSLPGDRRIAARACSPASRVAVLGSVWMYRELRGRARTASAGSTCSRSPRSLCGQLGILYVGVFSAAPLMVALGVLLLLPHRAPRRARSRSTCSPPARTPWSRPARVAGVHRRSGLLSGAAAGARSRRRSPAS